MKSTEVAAILMQQPKIERILTQMTEIQTQTQAELKKQVLSEDERELIKDLGWEIEDPNMEQFSLIEDEQEIMREEIMYPTAEQILKIADQEVLEMDIMKLIRQENKTDFLIQMFDLGLMNRPLTEEEQTMVEKLLPIGANRWAWEKLNQMKQKDMQALREMLHTPEGRQDLKGIFQTTMETCNRAEQQLMKKFMQEVNQEATPHSKEWVGLMNMSQLQTDEIVMTLL